MGILASWSAPPNGCLSQDTNGWLEVGALPRRPGHPPMTSTAVDLRPRRLVLTAELALLGHRAGGLRPPGFAVSPDTSTGGASGTQPDGGCSPRRLPRWPTVAWSASSPARPRWPASFTPRLFAATDPGRELIRAVPPPPQGPAGPQPEGLVSLDAPQQLGATLPAARPPTERRAADPGLDQAQAQTVRPLGLPATGVLREAPRPVGQVAWSATTGSPRWLERSWPDE